MMMRLFYQSFGVSRGSRDGRYGHVLKTILDRAAAAGTEISIHGLSPHRAIAEQYRYLEFLDKAEVMDNGLRAEKEGYDALVLLHELRELLTARSYRVIPANAGTQGSPHRIRRPGTRFRRYDEQMVPQRSTQYRGFE